MNKKNQYYYAICKRYGGNQDDEVYITNAETPETAAENAYYYFLVNTNDLVLRKIKTIEILPKGKTSIDNVKPIFTKKY